MNDDALLDLLRRFQQEDVQYVLVVGHAVRLNGFSRRTEDIDILLPSSRDLDPEWFEVPADAPENIRVADDLLIDLLFAANGETYESLQPHVRSLDIDGVCIRTLDIEGLLKTKTDYRDKDRIDREALERLRAQLRRED